MVQQVAERYALTAAHWGRNGNDAGVWGVDRKGLVTFVEAGADAGRRSPGSSLALVGERLDHGVAGDHADVRAAEAVVAL